MNLQLMSPGILSVRLCVCVSVCVVHAHMKPEGDLQQYLYVADLKNPFGYDLYQCQDPALQGPALE